MWFLCSTCSNNFIIRFIGAILGNYCFNFLFITNNKITSYQEGDRDAIDWYFCACPKAMTWISNVIGSWSYLFCVQWFKVRVDCSGCWYWWNLWRSLFILSFHNHCSPEVIEHKKNSMTCDVESIQYTLNLKCCIFI